MFLEYIKILGEESTRGGPPASHKGGGRALPPGRPHPCGPPGRPSTPIFCYMVCFDLEKIRRKLLGRSVVVSRRNLGRTNLGLRRSCSARETSPERGNQSHRHHQCSYHQERAISINIFTSTISSPNPSSSLVSNSYLQVRDWC